MSDVLVAVVDIAVVFRQQIDVMKDEAVERIKLKRLHDSCVVQPTLVEHSITRLHATLSFNLTDIFFYLLLLLQMLIFRVALSHAKCSRDT